MNGHFWAPRCSLSVPASSERMLARARDLSVDEVVLDLEDAVAANMKAIARRHAVVALAHGFAAQRVSVRINAPGTPWCHEDILALIASSVWPDSIIVPKVEGGEDIHFVETLIRGAAAADTRGKPAIALQALVETAAGIRAVDEIAQMGRQLTAVILGYADLAASLGRRGHDFSSWRSIQDRLLVAARAGGLAAIDGPCLRLDPTADVATEAAAASSLGFDGKWAIHPAQVSVITRAFEVTEAERAEAMAALAALASAHAGGAGAVGLEARMLDEASVRAANALLRERGTGPSASRPAGDI